MLDNLNAVTVRVEASLLVEALKRTKFAISTEETRYYLNGTYMHESGGKLCFCATDGHRLALVTTDIDAPATFSPVIIPRDDLAIIVKTFGGRGMRFKMVDLDVTAKRITFSIDGAPVVESVPIDGTFPDYRRVIPQSKNMKSAKIPRNDLLKALACLVGFKHDETPCVKLTFSADKLVLSAAITDTINADTTGQASCTVSAKTTDLGNFQIGFNGKYLLEMVKASSDLHGAQVELRANDPGSPCIILGVGARDACAVNVLMPMRV